ncbi:MAG: hypothetical protein ACRCSN_04770 [Dermatophilaceae bacterium]
MTLLEGFHLARPQWGVEDMPLVESVDPKHSTAAALRAWRQWTRTTDEAALAPSVRLPRSNA